MAQPTEKSPQITKVLNDMAESMSGVSREKSIYNNTCASCKNVAASFKDELSKKEYTITGLCQTCQDSIFG